MLQKINTWSSLQFAEIEFAATDDAKFARTAYEPTDYPADSADESSSKDATVPGEKGDQVDGQTNSQAAGQADGHVKNEVNSNGEQSDGEQGSDDDVIIFCEKIEENRSDKEKARNQRRKSIAVSELCVEGEPKD